MSHARDTLTGDLEDTLDCPNIKTLVVALESSIYCESVSFRDIYVFYEKNKRNKNLKLILNKMYLIYWFGYSNQPHSVIRPTGKTALFTWVLS